MEVLITFIVVAAIFIGILRLIGRILSPFIGNIIAGGILYWALSALSLVAFSWSFMDAVVVAIFGIPGTLGLAVWYTLMG